jgi:hypothetical protein
MKGVILAAAASGLIMSALALYPQWNLRELRGAEFNGAFATCDLDEMAYASYLQALIDGRPRRNDPYTGRDHAADSPQPESLFSIQFATAYLAAGLAWTAGLSAVEMMPVISVLSAFFTAIALFWLVYSITRSWPQSLAATLAVLTGGALISGIGAVNSLYDGAAYPFFPFLRRHIPSLSFPFLFAFIACMWNGLQAAGSKARLIYGIVAVICFAVLVYSYFYLWTSAAAFAGCFFIFSLLADRPERPSRIRFFVLVGAGCLVALVPYLIMLSGRSEMMDKAQLLVHTRQPDIFRGIVIYGAAAAAFIAAAGRWLRITPMQAAIIAAMGAAPLIAFNQQLITGRSLQPFHYEYYSINYVALLAVVLVIGALVHRLLGARAAVQNAIYIFAALIFMAWGVFEAVETTWLWDPANIARDEAMPVNLRLKQIGGDDIDGARSTATLNLDPLQADSQPTVAPQGVLWARHQHTFAGVQTWEENKLRYYKLIYFSDLDAEWLRRSLTGCPNIEACMALFGWDRFNPTLSADARPLTRGEIADEVERYLTFTARLSADESHSPDLSYVIYRTDAYPAFQNLGRWYEIGEAELHGRYELRPLRAKHSK